MHSSISTGARYIPEPETEADVVRNDAHALTGSVDDFNDLLDAIGGANVVLIGEASHGTHDFYKKRAEITKRLVLEKGFSAICVEGDWPDTLHVNRFIQQAAGAGAENVTSAYNALSAFQRFPTWMWRNSVVLDFIDWLHAHNMKHANYKVGFFGLDLYSLYTSMEATVKYLDRVDPTAAQRARSRYGCFDLFEKDSQAYGYAASFGMTKACEDEVIKQLVDLHKHSLQYESVDGRGAMDEFFFAEQNARVVRNAERYYRSMFGSRIMSWNLRDKHMMETLGCIEEHYKRVGQRFKAIIWAHNSHLGDARATEMGKSGELNLGQLVRDQYGGKSFLIGFSTFTGTVTAASNWDGPAERKHVRRGLPGSYEALFHDVGLPNGMKNFVVFLNKKTRAVELLRQPRLQRAIGVIYLPQSERMSHYFSAQLSDQFDAIIHIDETRALKPLDETTRWQTEEELPETYPTGL